MERDKKLVIFLPDWSDENPYLNCLAHALEKRDFKVVFEDYSQNLLPLSATAKKHPTAGVIHLHWISPLINRYYWSRNPIKRFFKLFLYHLVLILDIWLTKRRGIRIAWTVHNLYSHEARDTGVELNIRRLLANRVDVLFFHSYEAAKLVLQEYEFEARDRIAIAPHACYGGFYDFPPEKQSVTRLSDEMEAGTFTYLFFGNLRRYKGLEPLVQAFSKLEGEQLRLVIAGKVFEKEDEVWLSSAVAKDSRIIFKNGYVADEDVANLIKSSDVVVLPFVRTLSSGSALLAITYGRPLILPDLAKVFGVPGKGGAIYFNDGYSLEHAMRKAQKIDLVSYRNHNYQLANKLTWEAMAHTIETNYMK